MIVVATSDWIPAPREAPRRIFAIGDVHGRSDLLLTLHRYAEGLLDATDAPPTLPAAMVHLGDYIDRGPDSVGALQAVLGWRHPHCVAVALPGNHEQIMLQFLDACEQGAGAADRQGETLALWAMNGGSELCAELGIVSLRDPAAVGAAVLARLAPLLPPLRALPAAVRFGPYLFVHAGLPRLPDGGVVPLAAVVGMAWRDEHPGRMAFRGRNSALWIREGFLDVETAWEDGVVVIHGHTIVRRGPEIRANRIGLDLGAFKTGRLAMIELAGRRMRFHVAERKG